MKQYKWHFERHRPISTLAIAEFLRSVKKRLLSSRFQHHMKSFGSFLLVNSARHFSR